MSQHTIIESMRPLSLGSTCSHCSFELPEARFPRVPCTGVESIKEVTENMVLSKKVGLEVTVMSHGADARRVFDNRSPIY